MQGQMVRLLRPIEVVRPQLLPPMIRPPLALVVDSVSAGAEMTASPGIEVEAIIGDRGERETVKIRSPLHLQVCLPTLQMDPSAS